MLVLYNKELLASCQNPKLEDYPLLAVYNCLFNIFAATLHIWRPPPPSATSGRMLYSGLLGEGVPGA
jgi:hypothetical protein